MLALEKKLNIRQKTLKFFKKSAKRKLD